MRRITIDQYMHHPASALASASDDEPIEVRENNGPEARLVFTITGHGIVSPITEYNLRLKKQAESELQARILELYPLTKDN